MSDGDRSPVSALDRDQRLAVMRLLEAWVDQGIGSKVTGRHAFWLSGSPRWLSEGSEVVPLIEVAVERVMPTPPSEPNPG